jgi:hypothetical protein
MAAVSSYMEVVPTCWCHVGRGRFSVSQCSSHWEVAATRNIDGYRTVKRYRTGLEEKKSDRRAYLKKMERE